MDKKLIVFSIFVSLFILGGLSFVDARTGGGIRNYGMSGESQTGRVAVNTSFGTVAGGSTVTLEINFTNYVAFNSTHRVKNVSIFYNTSGLTGWSIGTLASVTSNSTCTSNVCANTSGPIGNRLLVTWTLPSTNGATLIRSQIWRANQSGIPGSKFNYTSLLNVDTTKATVTLVGNVTDALVFTSLSRFDKAYPGGGDQSLFLARVSDRNVRNCTLWTQKGFNEKVTFAANKTGLNTVTAYRGFLNDSTAGTLKFWNASQHFVGAVPNGKFTWGVVCYDNATTPNYGVASTNRTFYFDNTTPQFPGTHGVFFDDSDSNAKDTSKTGLFQIGGVWTSELLETLTFTCDITEANLDVVTFDVKEPGSTVFALAGKSTNGKKTFDYTNTKRAGVYEVKCTASDIAANKTTSSTFKFRLQAEDEGEVPGTPTYVKPFNVDFSKIESKVLAENQGKILTMSFDGKTEHTVKYERVTSNSVTLIIASHPKTINLKIGESQNVDVNDDGLNDVSVKLNAVIDGKASVEYRKLTGAEQVAREEGGVTTTTRPSGTPTETGRSTLGIWIIVLIVVVGVIIYLVAKRKKK